MAELFRCTPSPAGPPAQAAACSKGPPTAVDIHCHVLCERTEAMARQLGAAGGSSGTMQFASPDSREAARLQRAAIHRQLTDIDTRLADMDTAGIDLQVLSPAPNQYHYDLDADIARQLARQVNETMASMASHPSGRFAGLGTVPLQHPALAVDELRHAVRHLGLRGVEIGTHVAGADLDTLGLEPFFAEAESLGALLFLHPAGFSEGRRLGQYFLNNVIGNPLDSTVAVSRLIFSGLLERRPGLKVCIAHGGGYLPAYAGRMDHAWRVRPECRACLHSPPSHSLRRLHFDTLVHDSDQLAQLLRVYGPERLLLGTDYPYDMGDADARHRIDHLPGLTAETRAMLLGDNARRLLNLPTHELR